MHLDLGLEAWKCLKVLVRLRLCLKYKISFFFKGNSLTSAFKEAD